jgi:diguanylate cyclase (GGDEF)-like protein
MQLSDDPARLRESSDRVAVTRDVRRTRLFWPAMVAVLLAVGAAGSIIGAWQVHRTDERSSRQVFQASAAQIASTLKLAILHEQDLVVGAAAVFVRNPQTTEAEFRQWTESTAAFKRYPELQGISVLTMVPASQLGTFAARDELDPPGPLSPGGTLQVSPPGYRRDYCLETVAQSRNPALALPAGTDFCQTSLGPQFLRARDTGLALYIPYKTGKLEELGLGNAIYEGGTTPSTVSARRADLIGWTGIEVLPGVLLSTALQHHPSTAVSFQTGTGNSKVTFTGGSAPAHAQSTSIDLHNGWHVEVLAAANGGSLLTDGNSSALLFGGILFTALLAVLIYVLGTSRSRALLLVEERTDELHYQAFHDALTGLPNRALINDRVQHMLAQAKREPRLVAALFLDLDNFKDINDTLGHKAGDELLAGVATRLSGLLRKGDTVGRLGGDEFIVLTEGTATSSGAEALADRILQALALPFEVSGAPVAVTATASIGIAIGTQDISPGELLRNADIALYHAKATGKYRFAIYSDRMKKSIDDRQRLDAQLHTALNSGQFFLLYQPTITLSSGEISGVEALLRWRHPTRGVLPPSEFVPALESTGLIIPVGRWVLETACRAGAAWHGQGHRIAVSVNVSPKQLQRGRITDDVRGALSASGFDPTMLVLELTETSLMRAPGETISRLLRLRRLGVRLAIDDFGTGFSSLAYLQQFPIDQLKIDQSFVAGLVGSEKSSAIIRTFVQLGKTLGLEVVAEGIETGDQRDELEGLGVDTGQGFLFSGPLDVETFDTMLGARSMLAERVTS